MGEKIVVGPVNRGLKTDRTAFVIDNDSFPTLLNAYQWRGRVKRKRGTSLLTRLTRYFDSSISSYGSTTSFNLTSGSGNLLSAFSLQSTGSIVPGTVTLTDTTSGNTYTDNSLGALIGVPSGTGTINYASGAITIVVGASHTINNVSFNYYPGLPVMGLEDFVMDSNAFPGNIDFDTKYAYNMLNTTPYNAYDVSFYKNPITASYPDYVEKTSITPTSWNGQDYQQFYTVNYQGALWATNGIEIPFDPTNIGMQYKPIVSTTVENGSNPATVTLEITGHGLVVGDFVFVNEVQTTTGINYQTGYVITVTDVNNVIVEFPYATIASNGTGGIAQYLTNRSDTTKDCLRWYDGDPTNGNATSPILNGHLGWVNFAPPLSQGDFSIASLPADQYYLVGARMIIPFKDRLLFLGPVVQTSASGSQVYLQDTVIYSQNGTPYYTASFTAGANYPLPPITTPPGYVPILVPVNQTAEPSSYFSNATGFGGFITAGVDQPMNTVSSNEDVLIIGFDTLQTRFVYSGNDILPFNFFIINSELGSSSTFSTINTDKGVITRGSRGFIITNQTECSRIDLDNPDQVFQFDLTINGTERVCAQRDFINEWIYFTYLSNEHNDTTYRFPNQTFQYNYRDNSWAIFNECYTTYGAFREQTGFTWQTVGNTFSTWNSWNEPWNSGSSSLINPKVIAGNQQGFVLLRDEGTSEGNSLFIQNIVGLTVTSPNHCLNEGDYIIISGCLGTIASSVNGLIFSVENVTDANTFILNPGTQPPPSGTYLGSGLIKRMYVPYIQTKQFPVSWGISRKTRIGAQQYLFTTTDNGQITLLIFLSQNADSAYNTGPIVPEIGSVNDSLIYSTLLYTCPESTNLGLTPANINLQTPTAIQQAQTWHRMNTSLIGDTVQIGFTMNDAQMRDTTFSNQFAEIELHAFILDVNASQILV